MLGGSWGGWGEGSGEWDGGSGRGGGGGGSKDVSCLLSYSNS